MSTEWPPVGSVVITDEVLPADIPSKSPMKYAIDYVAVDVDGNVIADTDYFIVKSDAWARARQLYDDANDVRTVTFREL